jgi:hypothetical protein
MSNQNIKLKSSSESEIKQVVDDLVTYAKEMPIESSDMDTQLKTTSRNESSKQQSESLFNRIRYKHDEVLSQMLNSDEPIESENR